MKEVKTEESENSELNKLSKMVQGWVDEDMDRANERSDVIKDWVEHSEEVEEPRENKK